MAGSRSTPDGPRRQLSLAEHLVLGLIAEGPTHGFAVARLVGTQGPVGQIYRVPRPIVYRAVDRLALDRLIEIVDVQVSQQGPQRTRYRVTPAGRKVVGDWLSRPVAHVRDVRVEFLAKLVLLHRAQADVGPLVAAQRDRLAPILEGLEHQPADSPAERMIVAWRRETALAAQRFLDALGSGILG